MLVRFSKPNGVPVLTCLRADGTSTHSKSRHGAFFGPHDMMHFAVETTLGLTRAFFGLIAAGRSIAWFEEAGVAPALPAEALLAEHIVNILMLEQGAGEAHDEGSFNTALAAALAGGRSDRASPRHAHAAALAPPRRVSADELAEIRARFASLLFRARGLGEGGSLEVEFPEHFPAGTREQ